MIYHGVAILATCFSIAEVSLKDIPPVLKVNARQDNSLHHHHQYQVGETYFVTPKKDDRSNIPIQNQFHIHDKNDSPMGDVLDFLHEDFLGESTGLNKLEDGNEDINGQSFQFDNRRDFNRNGQFEDFQDPVEFRDADELITIAEHLRTNHLGIENFQPSVCTFLFINLILFN